MTGPRMPPPKATTAARLRWRVVVRTDGKLDPSRATRPLAWHLVTCAEPEPTPLATPALSPALCCR